MINIKKYIFELIKKKRQIFEKKIYQKMLSSNDEFNLIDIGGYKGIQPRWEKLEKYINFHTFEPNKEEAKKIKLNCKNLNVYNHALSDQDGELILNICKEPGVSSVLEPNFEFLKKYKDVERFKIIEKTKVNCKKLDSVGIENIDFVKIDVQGYNLEVLRGASNSLKKCFGLEIECEFKEIYKNQSMFNEIELFLNDNNFELIDFLDIVRWNQTHNNSYKENKNQGEIVFVNALFIKKNLIEEVKDLDSFKKLILILINFGQFAKANFLIDLFRENYNLSKEFNNGLKILSNSIKKMEKTNKLFFLISKLFGSEFQTIILK